MIDRLRKEQVSIIFISHALEEALEISDRITILRDGAHIVTDDAKTFTRETVIRHMVGRSLTDELYGRAGRWLARAAARREGPERAEPVDAKRRAEHVLFDLRRAGHRHLRPGRLGPHGNGQDHRRRRQARLLSWRRRAFRRTIRALSDAACQAVGDGVVYVTEDRKGEGFFETMSVAENIYVGQISSHESHGFVASMSEMRELAAEWTKKLNIKALNSDARVIRTFRRQSAEGGDREGAGPEAQADHIR